MNNAKPTQVCCICGEEFTGWGNNPWPVVSPDTKLRKDADDVCCDKCNRNFVIPARIAMIKNNK